MTESPPHSPAVVARAAVELARFVQAHAPLTVLTGAGCSTASGISDYRDHTGAWKRPQPMQHQVFVRSAAARRRYWARSMHGWPAIADARPSGAHRALAELAAAGFVTGLITQNVDGLHQRAGQGGVIDLHGRLDRVVCLDCGGLTGRAALQRWFLEHNGQYLRAGAQLAPDGDADLDPMDLTDFVLPECRHCGGILKPDVVFFGDSVPAPRVADAYAQVAGGGALLVVGSSLMVYSGLRFCRRARELGRPLVAVNQGVTRADAWLQAKYPLDCGLLLSALCRELGLGERSAGYPV